MRILMPHQKTAIKFLNQHNGQAGLFMAPGTGKTLVAIRWSLIKRMPFNLIECRRDDYYTWETELLEEGETDFYFVKNGKDKIPKCKWIGVTYDLIKNPKIYQQLKKIANQYSKCLLIADESHMVKRQGSRRTKRTLSTRKWFTYRIPMTGSAITNDEGDVFTQCLLADNGKTFGDNWWRFRKRYYVQSGPGWYIKRNSRDIIRQKLKHCSFYVHEDDVLSLPPIRYFVKSVQITGAQRRQQEKLLNDWEAEIGGKIIEIDHTITQLQKLKQVASGFIYNEDKNTIKIRSRKIPLLIDLLTSNEYFKCSPKIVIWCSFRQERRDIKEALDQHNISNIVFKGTAKQRKQARINFRDTDTRCFIAQVDSGVGMNELKVANVGIYFSNSLRVVSRQQSMRRIRRKGSEIHAHITYVDLITENSIDETIYKSIKKDMDVADYILRYHKNDRISNLI